jgi:glycosyltransferase involved in cell wall biosynthesis
MRISSATIITPCFNAERVIRRTAESIVRQTAVRSGRIRLQYLVCDGGSTDGTLEAIREVCGDGVELTSEPDRGMYDALAKGLRRANGDVVAYLNAGDVYSPTALDVVSDVMEQTGAEWLTGLDVGYNRNGQVIHVHEPYRYRRRLIRAGYYSGRFLPFIQQESTFWKRRLLALVDLERLSSLRLAGDHYLWTRFATATELAVVQSYLGGFAREPGQLSEAREEYWREQRDLSERSTPWEGLVALADSTAWRIRAMLAEFPPRGTIRWSSRQDRWVAR